LVTDSSVTNAQSFRGFTTSWGVLVKTEKRERGAVAVEMAVVLPLLLMLLLGIVEFGRAYNVQISLTQAAREGARFAAIHHGDSDFEADDIDVVALAAAPSLSGLPVNVDDDADGCTDDANVEVTATVTLGSLSGLFDAELLGMPVIFPLELTGVGVMQCGG
jgi:Flp pilus assembly protein TadG